MGCGKSMCFGGTQAWIWILTPHLLAERLGALSQEQKISRIIQKVFRCICMCQSFKKTNNVPIVKTCLKLHAASGICLHGKSSACNINVYFIHAPCLLPVSPSTLSLKVKFHYFGNLLSDFVYHCILRNCNRNWCIASTEVSWWWQKWPRPDGPFCNGALAVSASGPLRALLPCKNLVSTN